MVNTAQWNKIGAVNDSGSQINEATSRYFVSKNLFVVSETEINLLK